MKGKSLEKLVGLLLLVLIGFMYSLSSVNVADAEKLSPHRYTNTFTWTVNLDTTAAIVYDTQTVVAAGMAKIFNFTGLSSYSSVAGWIKISSITCDTGDAAADVVDTTKDSMKYQIYTYCLGDTTEVRLLDADSIIKAGSEPTVWFSIPAESLICDAIYFTFATSIKDSDYSVVRAGAGVTYTAQVNMVAKP